ncbi:hypothetical protein SAMN04488109_2815 [Chryseolinea serpens]|uniref:Uncharacterized protein n=1 Tax=Chryseolinea serpens TaxID=947013 RepID=A0A1M5QHP7_9BACT|nr:hypothetical protein SAMN04488109_2815 [Chryseolinea serpens]
MELIVGNYVSNVKCENFKDSETGRIRVRPLPDQGLPTDLVINAASMKEKDIRWVQNS